MIRILRHPLLLSFAFCLLPSFVGGCQGTSKANIELRKENVELREQVAQLRRQREGDLATIRALEAGQAVPTLPAERLARLFTVHGIALGKLTGGIDLDADTPGDEALRVVVTPQDQSGQTLKAAGAVVIELFDLALEGEQRIGRWELSTDEAKQRWIGSALIDGYVLELRWQQPPEHAELTVKVTFTDELTGRAFTTQKPIRITIPPPNAEPRSTAHE